MNIRKAFALALAIVASARASASEPSLETVTPRQVFTDEAAALTLTGDGLEEGASVALLDGGPFVAGSLQPVPLDAGPVVRLDARYVAVASYLEIDVIDVSDPRHPVLAASVPGPRSPIAMATEAGVLAVSSYYPTGEVQLYDVSRPTEPTFVAAVATPLVPERLVLADGVLFVGSWWGYCGFFSVGALTAFSVADPAAPVRLGELPLTGCTHDLAIQQGVAWLLTQEAGEPGMRLTAVDVTDPWAPVELSRREWTNYDPEDWIGLAVEGSTGFVVQEYPHTLRSLDLSDPSSPRVLYDAETWLGGYFRNAVADRGRLFLDLDGIRLFDVRRPEAPRGFTKVGPFGIRGFAVHGDHVYASADSNAGGFLVLDVSVPLRPAAFRPLEGLPGTPLASSGPIVYAVDDSSRVRIQDWSDPDSPREIAVISDAGSVGALAVDGDRLFVSDVASSGNRIVAYDVGDPSHPVRLGSIGGIYSYHVASAGGFVYALDLISRAMLAIDARDPAAMHVTSSLPLGRLYDWRLALSADGSRAYVMQVPSFQGPIFLLTFDLADPGSPRNDGVTGWFGAGGRLVVDGTDVWIADREAGVLRIDAADPTRMIVSVVIPDLHALGLARVGPLLAVTSGGQTPALDELRVYDISRPEGLRLVQQHPMEKASFGAFPIGDTLIVDETMVRLQPVLPDLRRSGERTGATSLLPGHPPGPYDVQVVNPD
ncbi:MAG TPA: hypothetical protein VFB67_03970, partial [Candidatus Polarisedimenticolaceae bacterium]|nr:hypothetical protein [Candidatus Polarisedimenticolaceae bacterium]